MWAKWEKLSSTAGRAILAGGQSVPTPRMQNLVLPIQYAHQAAPSRRVLKLLASRAIGCTEASCGHHGAIVEDEREAARIPASASRHFPSHVCPRSHRASRLRRTKQVWGSVLKRLEHQS